jgi:hypothetical protein
LVVAGVETTKLAVVQLVALVVAVVVTVCMPADGDWAVLELPGKAMQVQAAVPRQYPGLVAVVVVPVVSAHRLAMAVRAFNRRSQGCLYITPAEVLGALVLVQLVAMWEALAVVEAVPG